LPMAELPLGGEAAGHRGSGRSSRASKPGCRALPEKFGSKDTGRRQRSPETRIGLLELDHKRHGRYGHEVS
jgi:hypothetical protein